MWYLEDKFISYVRIPTPYIFCLILNLIAEETDLATNTIEHNIMNSRLH